MSSSTFEQAVPTYSRAPTRVRKQYAWLAMIPFVLCHLAVFGAVWSGVTWQAVVLAIVLYVVRIFGITAGYHRYFSHRSYETSRPVAFVLAWIGESTMQRGPLWWAAHHRHHHLYSDTEQDLHSPKQHGLFHAHLGWIYDDVDETDTKRIQDFAKYPELRFLDHYWLLPPVVLAVACFLAFGWSGLFIGFFASTVATWHGTFVINSLAHVWGNRRYETSDTSRNSVLLAIVTLGEGWHNNHHRYFRSCRQGFFWWELDLTYLVLKAMSWVGLVWNIHEPSKKVLAEGREADAKRAAHRKSSIHVPALSVPKLPALAELADLPASQSAMR